MRLDVLHSIQISSLNSESIVKKCREVFSHRANFVVKLEMFNLIIMFHEKVSVGTQSCTLRTLTLFADRVTHRESVCPGMSWTHCSYHMSLGQQQNSRPCAQENKQMHAYVGHIHTLQRLTDHMSVPRHLQF